MLSLEEYIEKRKTEDGINEFDVSQKINNIRTCINYIFEYFDQYLSIQGAERHTITENEKIRKYGGEDKAGHVRYRHSSLPS